MQEECSVTGCDRPLRARGYCGAHYQRWQKGKPLDNPICLSGLRGPIKTRLPHLIDKSGDCWEWLGSRDSKGYGQTEIEGKLRRAHRVVYEHEIGPIPDGLVLDHLCRNPNCVNPAHLEPVTQRINILRGEGFAAVNARKTHCKRGHLFDEANTRIRANGNRGCRTCHLEQKRARRR